MNQKITTQDRSPASSIGFTQQEGGAWLQPESLGDVVRFAELMCQSNAGIPQYLRGNAPDCMAITIQAMQWGFNPFSVAQKSYKVKDVLAYEAQLIAAVVNTRSGIKGRLKYAYEGEGEQLTCTVSGMLDGEEYSYTSPPMGHITTKNSPLWKTDPRQQLGYFSARSWARRYTPEVLLGVYDREEAEQFRGPDNAKDVTPSRPSLAERLAQSANRTETAAETQEGFSATFERAEPEFVPTANPDGFGDDLPTHNADDSGFGDDAFSEAYRAGEAAAKAGLDRKAIPARFSGDPDTKHDWQVGYDSVKGTA